MIFPVAARELRVASRRRATYWNRTLTAGVGFAICFWMLVVIWNPRSFAGAAPGIGLFRALFWFAFFYVMAAGLRFTASALSRERHEGTLGLLFLTDLSGYDVVFGKIAGTSLDAFYSTLGLLPTLGIPLLFGGVTVVNFLCASIILLVSLFFSLAAGILASSLCPDERSSMSCSFLILIVFGLLFPLTADVGSVYYGFGALADWLKSVSPGALAGYAFAGPRSHFWRSLFIVHGLSWIFVILASGVVSRVWQDKPAVGWRLRWQRKSHDLKMGSPPVRRELRRGLLEINPVLWLCSRGRHTRWYVWVFLTAMLIVLIFALAIDKTFSGMATMPLFYITSAFLKYWVASTASHSIAAGKAGGNLELIFSTPLEVPEILRGHWMALERQFRKPFIAVLAVEMLTMAFSGLNSPEKSLVWVMAHMANMALLVTDSYTLVWTGLWQAMTRKTPQMATSVTIVRVLLVPWFIMAALVSFCFPMMGANGGIEFIVAWLIIGGVGDMIMLANAREKLECELRAAATRQWNHEASEKIWPGKAGLAT